MLAEESNQRESTSSLLRARVLTIVMPLTAAVSLVRGDGLKLIGRAGDQRECGVNVPEDAVQG